VSELSEVTLMLCHVGFFLGGGYCCVSASLNAVTPSQAALAQECKTPQWYAGLLDYFKELHPLLV